MEVIVRGEGWEKKVQATDIDDALGSLAGWGYVSKVYTVSDDGGKTERRVRWDQAKRRTFPAVAGDVMPASKMPPRAAPCERSTGYLVRDEAGTWQRHYSPCYTPCDAVRAAIAEGREAAACLTRSPDSNACQRWRIVDGEPVEAPAVSVQALLAEHPEALREMAACALRGGASGVVEQVARAIVEGDASWSR